MSNSRSKTSSVDLFKQLNPDVFAKLRNVTTGVVFNTGERACTHGVINEDGDLLFITSGDTIYGYNLFNETCFRTYNNEFEQTHAVFNGVDVNFDSTYLVAIADKSIYVYDVQTGKLCIEEKKAMMECCCFQKGLNKIAVVSSARLNQKIVLTLYSIVHSSGSILLQQKGEYQFETGISCIVWPTDNQIIVGDEKGNLYLLKLAFQNKNEPYVITAEKMKDQPHRGEILSITVAPHSISEGKIYFATASKDSSAKLFYLDSNGMHKVASYTHSFHVSCVAISPITHHIVLASSAEHKDVARRGGSIDFTINFFHTIFQKEFASIKVHKSTINWIGFTPDGFTLVTASDEGTTEIIRLGEDYRQLILEQDAELKAIQDSLKQ